ncbi:MAG: AAA family ATPase, partial [Chloroflexi bacterium]|nr:AAA family ATPase [Chloroflexota bacterium]
MTQPLPPASLSRRCDLQVLACETSKDLTPLEIIIGQERAVRALRFGLAIKQQGFNIFVAGLPGTGRTTTVERFLAQQAKDKPTPGDWCYAYNFADPYHPRSLALPVGRGKQLQADMKTLVEAVTREIRKAFESEEYALKREESVREFRRRREELFNKINEKAQEQGFLIQSTSVGLLTIPVVNGKPLEEEEFMALSAQEREVLSEKRNALQDDLKAAVRQARAMEKSIADRLGEVDREVALFVIGPQIDELQEKYQECEQVTEYLDAVQNDILENLEQFRDERQEQPQGPFPMPGGAERHKRYEVNVLVDNSSASGAPVVAEFNPTYNNLFGRIEKEAQFGALVTDFTMIRSGSLHRANGGFLVLPAEELLRDPFSWDGIKRAIRNREITIEEAAERLGYM